MSLTRIVILGAGTMGTNMALDFARSGFEPQVVEVDEEQRARSREYARFGARFLHLNGLAKDDPEKVVGRIAFLEHPVRVMRAFSEAQWIVEAVPEKLELKHKVLTEAEAVAPEDAIVTSNTSSFLPSRIAGKLRRPERMLVTHFWNPPHLLPLVEVVPHPGTAPEVVDALLKVLVETGKHPILLRKEISGFIGNRLAFALQREAMDLIAKGVASAEDIDAVAALGFGRRIPISGIFGTCDLGGLDVYAAICDELFPGLCNDAAAPEKLKELVAQGKLGVKTGAGWRVYSQAEIEKLRHALSEELVRHANRDHADHSRSKAAQHTMILRGPSSATLPKVEKRGQ
ncbi:MAG: 3-hydroxyacyl-CoA dehydrogenase family protein [Planctomycetota bacterium]|nr:3-hydroxyacyl-CoA dehydrogenase family protein [Planctomycetota bacterium]